MKIDLQTMRDELSQFNTVRFIEEEVDGHRVVTCCYMITDTKLWDHPLGREARGVSFDAETGKVISRPFEKFFNVGEVEETQPDKIKALYESLPASKVQLLEKRDGSLITPAMVGDQLRLKSKKSYFSDVVNIAKRVIANDRQLLAVAMCNCMALGYTPIFELTSPDNRVVLDYGDREELTLLAIRHMDTGEYITDRTNVVWKLFEGYCNFVPEWELHSWDELMHMKQSMEGVEGWVLNLDGMRVKIKTDWYLARHRMLDVRERDVADMVVDETLDDMKQFAQANDLDLTKILEIEQRVVEEVSALALEARSVYVMLRDQYGGEAGSIAAAVIRKSIALACKDNEYLSRFLGSTMALLDNNVGKFDNCVKRMWINQYREGYSMRSVVNSKFGQGEEDV